MDLSNPPNEDLKDKDKEYKEELPPNLPYETPPDVIDVGDIRSQDRVKVMRRYAVLSSIAYDMYNHGYEKAEQNMKEHLPFHNLDKELSDKNSIVAFKAHENKPNDVIISYRGTDPLNPSDLGADAQIAVGLPISRNIQAQGRFEEAQNKYDAVKSKYPNANITTTGHSLGGTQANLIGKNNNVRNYIFNAGSSPLDRFFENVKDTQENKTMSYYVPGDIVSQSRVIFENDEKVAVEPHKWLRDLAGSIGLGVINPALGVSAGTASMLYDIHGLHNFLPPESFKEELEPDDILYRWVSPIHYEMKAEQRLQKSRGNLVNFSQQSKINREDFFENYKKCINPYDPRCQIKK
tara:strand:+ start:472 stop:1521 length:1050 start_codon:yes stop_codon:yes gene_type:complete